VWAVPAHPARRDGAVALPAESGRGRRPQRPWPPGAAGSQARDATAWHRRDGRDGRPGPLVGAAVQSRVVSRTHRRQPGAPATLVVLRSRDRAQAQVGQVASALSTAAPETPLGAWAQGAQAAQRLAACRQRSQSAAGVADDAGRHGPGWQQHHTRA
jgi:hypothetical protein